MHSSIIANSQLSENQILKKIDAWDDQDKISTIIDFVEPLSDTQKTPKVLSELARAYNNMYWLDPTANNYHWLKKAIDTFLKIEPKIQEQDLYSWHFRIGWSYFYLGDADNAKIHFDKHLQLCDCPQEEVPKYLDCIALANAENGKRSCAEIWNGGVITITDQIWFFKKALAEHAPHLLERLDKPASEQELTQAEQTLGMALPEELKILYRSFSGQIDNLPFFVYDEHWVKPNDIKSVQARIISHLETHFGKDWQTIILPAYNEEDDDDPANESATFFDTNFVKNTLYNPKWLPIIASDTTVFCYDLDPAPDGAIGQIVTIQLGRTLDEYFVNNIFGFNGLLALMTDNLKTGFWQYDEERCALKDPDSEPVELVYSTADELALTDFCNNTWGRVGKIIADKTHNGSNNKPKCDILVLYPNPDNPEDNGGYAIVTRGVGAVPMGDTPSYVELMLYLPASWNPDGTTAADTAPFEWLRAVASLVFDGSYIDNCHTMPIEMEGTDFKCVILAKAIPFDEDDERQWLTADLPSGRSVAFLSLVPIYQSETDYRLDNGSAALLEKLLNLPDGLPVELNPHRPNVCQDYVAKANPYALEEIAWAFGNGFYPSLDEFGAAVFNYNQDIDNDLSHINPFAVIFANKTVKFIYEAWLKTSDDLHPFEQLLDADALNEPATDGYHQVDIIATTTAASENMVALEFLQWINNILYNKELGDHIFFEGVRLSHYDEDGTPVVYVNLGS